MRKETIYIAEDGKRFENLLDCEVYEKKLDKKRGEENLKEIKKLSDEFLLSVGFDVSKYNTELEKNQALNMTWLIFDEYGNVKGLKTCGRGLLERHGIKCDFRYISGDDKSNTEIMENWLRKNKLYGHALISFADRKHIEFYKWDLLDKLENLCWEVKNGKLVNNAW